MKTKELNIATDDSMDGGGRVMTGSITEVTEHTEKNNWSN